MDLVNEYLDVGYLSTAKFTRYYDEGFLYSGDYIFLMNEENEFFPLENIKGNDFPYVEEQSGNLFFLAIDPEFGRQLFTTKLLSFITSTENIEEQKNNINVFPNPASEVLNLPEFGTPAIGNAQQYSVYSMNGCLVDFGITSGFINIRKYLPGSYVLKIKSEGQQTKETIFIKQ